MSACKRCHGEGQIEIDRCPGIPEENCHRCDGSGVEPDIPGQWRKFFERDHPLAVEMKSIPFFMKWAEKA